MVETLVHRKHYRHHFTSIFFLTLIASVGILMGTTPLVDNWTNLGGFVGGFSMAMALRLTHRALQGSAPYIEGFMVVFQVFWFLLVGCFVVGGCIGIFLNKDSRQECNWCRQLTCVDMNWWDCDVAVLPPDDYQLKCEYDIKGNLTATILCPSVTRSLSFHADFIFAYRGEMKRYSWEMLRQRISTENSIRNVRRRVPIPRHITPRTKSPPFQVALLLSRSTDLRTQIQ